MKEIVPFKKEIHFKTYVDEITSISLDHKIDEIKDNDVCGVFNLYLEYKENDVSMNILNYSDEIPFTISLDDKYILDNIKVDIDDFYYEIDDKDVTLFIDLLVDNLDMKDDELKNIIPKKDEREVAIIDDTQVTDLFKEDDTKVELNIPKYETYDAVNENFITYKIYIVKENDTYNSICTRYGITKEELDSLNNIKEIKLGDKLIIPTYNK